MVKRAVGTNGLTLCKSYFSNSNNIDIKNYAMTVKGLKSNILNFIENM